MGKALIIINETLLCFIALSSPTPFHILHPGENIILRICRGWLLEGGGGLPSEALRETGISVSNKSGLNRMREFMSDMVEGIVYWLLSDKKVVDYG